MQNFYRIFKLSNNYSNLDNSSFSAVQVQLSRYLTFSFGFPWNPADLLKYSRRLEAVELKRALYFLQGSVLIWGCRAHLQEIILKLLICWPSEVKRIYYFRYRPVIYFFSFKIALLVVLISKITAAYKN